MGVKSIFIKIFIILFISISIPNFSNSEEYGEKFKNLFDKIKKEGDDLLNQSLKSFSSIMNELENILDAEILSLKKITENKTEIDIQDKMDSIRLYLDEVSELKKKQTNMNKKIKLANFTIYNNLNYSLIYSI